MKQVELARKLGISKSYLSMILSGQRIPNPDLIERISSLLPVNFKASFLPHNPKVVGSNPTPATTFYFPSIIFFMFTPSSAMCLLISLNLPPPKSQ